MVDLFSQYMMAEITRYQGIIADKDKLITTLIQNIDWLLTDIWKYQRRLFSRRISLCAFPMFEIDEPKKLQDLWQQHTGIFDYFPAHWFDDPIPAPTIIHTSTPSLLQMLEQIAKENNEKND